MRPTATSPISEESVKQAQRILADGGLIALPTETVYGLAADATNDLAVASIFAAKGRPHFNPLIAHFASTRHAAAQVSLSPGALEVARHFWPGPLTIVAPLACGTSQVSAIARDGGNTLAVRVPQVLPALNELLNCFPAGLVAPSANPSGKLSPTTAMHVAQALGDKVDMVLDGGPCSVGVESTILDTSCDPWRILRHGGVTQAALEALVGPLGHDLTPARIKAPGQMAAHYAPNAKILLNQNWHCEGDGDGDGQSTAPLTRDVQRLGFGDVQGANLNLSAQGDVVEAAANLFAHLAQLDAHPGTQEIHVSPIPLTGLGMAINDRLHRAAATHQS